MEKLLVADIGGTSSRFALFNARRMPDSRSETLASLEMGESHWFKTAEFSSFESLLQAAYERFELAQSEDDRVRQRVDRCVIAAAGPVHDGYCSPPNIAWGIDLRNLRTSSHTTFFLINDFVAQAFATVSPLQTTFETIVEGQAVEAFPRVIIGAGTGLGTSALVPDGNGGFLGVAAEAGHCSIAIESSEELPFFQYLESVTERRYVEWEDVLSGKGLERTHFYCTREQLSAQEVSQTLEPGSATLALFSRFLGRMCRNFCLEYMARGGIYLAGGVVAKNPILLRAPEFFQALHTLAVPSISLAEVPLILMDEEDSGLWGAASYGVMQEVRK